MRLVNCENDEKEEESIDDVTETFVVAERVSPSQWMFNVQLLNSLFLQCQQIPTSNIDKREKV